MNAHRPLMLILALAVLMAVAGCTTMETPAPTAAITAPAGPLATNTAAPIPTETALPPAPTTPPPAPTATTAPLPQPSATSAPAPTSDFCADTRVTALIDTLTEAVRNQDGDLLSSVVSPARGLNVEYIRMGTIANYTPEEAKWVFKSTYETSWGLHPGSGAEVKGTFHDLVAPKLADVLLSANTQRVCNKLMVGGASYQASLPDSYPDPLFYSLYRPGASGDELNWRTWVVVFEYDNGKPYIIGLHHFEWEP